MLYREKARTQASAVHSYHVLKRVGEPEKTPLFLRSMKILSRFNAVPNLRPTSETPRSPNASTYHPRLKNMSRTHVKRIKNSKKRADLP